jgi:antitoxin component YwqK of YwqJK toxin-antitoxin module
MAFNKYIAYLWMIILSLSACGPKEIVTKYGSGKIKEKYQINDKSEKHGKYETFHDNGNRLESATYANGKLINTRSVYRYDGTLDFTETYDLAGLLDGPYIIYQTDGKTVQIQKNYKANILQGLLKAFYSNGKIKEEVNIVDNEENGPFTEYYQNGAIHWKGQYRNGDNEYGDLIEYDSLGIMIKKMLCDSQAICRTVWKAGMPITKSTTTPNN